MKCCTKCGEEKPKEAFSGCFKNPDKLQYWCKACRAKIQSEDQRKNPDKTVTRAGRWRAKNPEKSLSLQRAWKYGVTDKQVEEMLIKQGHKCAICGGDPTCVDHDHDTGKFRGMLCRHCNCSLGGFKDSPGLLQKAITYLLDSLG